MRPHLTPPRRCFYRAAGRTASSGPPRCSRQGTSRSGLSRCPPRSRPRRWTELRRQHREHRRAGTRCYRPTVPPADFCVRCLTFDPLPAVQLDLSGPLRDVGLGGDEGASGHGAVQPPLPHLRGQRRRRGGAVLARTATAGTGDRPESQTGAGTGTGLTNRNYGGAGTRTYLRRRVCRRSECVCVSWLVSRLWREGPGEEAGLSRALSLAERIRDRGDDSPFPAAVQL